MPTRLWLSIDVGGYLLRRLDVTMRVDSDRLPSAFRFELLIPRPGVRLEDFQVLDGDGQSVDFSMEDGQLVVPERKFEISYSVSVDYHDCVGVDRETEFNFPFMSNAEIYFSTGLFPYPTDLHSSNDEMKLDFQVVGLSAGWHSFSNLDVGGLKAAKLDNFFWYAAPELEPVKVDIKGSEKMICFQVLSQRGKQFPISADELSDFLEQYLTWLEKNIGPYRQLAEINILLLQAPPNYQELARNTTFATGENMINGILAYGPDSIADYRKLGCASYRDYLFEGLAHEVMHFYTTTAVQGQYKSVLYPTLNCDPVHARLIGESLNMYFIYQFVGEYLQNPIRLKNQLKFHLERALKLGRRDGLLDLYLFERWLKDKGSSLMGLFHALIKQKQAFPGPYSSGTILFEALREKMGIDASAEIEDLVLGRSVPDYNSSIQI
ncbi:MAG TPA: hypothetical protein VK851_12385 [Anaerolineales bacterium]|nr:hypothetical protein [Anaerolineales bacterium]